MYCNILILSYRMDVFCELRIILFWLDSNKKTLTKQTSKHLLSINHQFHPVWCLPYSCKLSRERRPQNPLFAPSFRIASVPGWSEDGLLLISLGEFATVRNGTRPATQTSSQRPWLGSGWLVKADTFLGSDLQFSNWIPPYNCFRYSCRYSPNTEGTQNPEEK